MTIVSGKISEPDETRSMKGLHPTGIWSSKLLIKPMQSPIACTLNAYAAVPDRERFRLDNSISIARSSGDQIPRMALQEHNGTNQAPKVKLEVPQNR
jgi:hypothetical protein